MPRPKKETQAEIQQRTMEDMQAQIAQLTQAMQALVPQTNTAPDKEQEDDDLEDEGRDANPFTVLGRNGARVQNNQNRGEQWEKSFKT